VPVGTVARHKEKLEYVPPVVSRMLLSPFVALIPPIVTLDGIVLVDVPEEMSPITPTNICLFAFAAWLIAKLVNVYELASVVLVAFISYVLAVIPALFFPGP
jgi:hypothetical protein